MKCQYVRNDKSERKMLRSILRELVNTPTGLQEGDKVKFNAEWLHKDKFWSLMNPARREFISNHLNDVFTVEYDKNHTDQPSVVCLKEDPSETKWLFADIELIKVEVDA